MHSTANVFEVLAEFLFVLQAIDFPLFEARCVVGGVFERREQFSEGNRPPFFTTNTLIKQAWQHVVCSTVEDGLCEKEGFIVVLAFPTEQGVVIPCVLFLHGLNTLKEHRRLVMQHLPREANQPTTGGQVEVFPFTNPLRKHRKERREIDVPRIERFFANQRKHQGNRTVEGVV